MSEQSNPYGAPDTGHVWDDTLRELTNDPPKWWMIGFHASWILVLSYGLIYPMWPLVHTHTKGLTGWTAIGEYKKDLEALDAKRAKFEDKIQTLMNNDEKGTAAAILADDELKSYVVRSAKVLFGDNCAACHGAGGQGNPNFPVLADDDWLYGGDINTIETTITGGRHGMMPQHGTKMTEAQIDELANAIYNQKPASSPLFMEQGCFACHGADGKGNHMLGSANLTDGIYRFAAQDQLASIKYTITHGVNDPADPQTRDAVMPKFGGSKLSKTDIKKLAVYVHELGGGQ